MNLKSLPVTTRHLEVQAQMEAMAAVQLVAQAGEHQQNLPVMGLIQGEDPAAILR